MASLDLDQSRSLLVQVVHALYSERHGPVPGALVKARIIREADQQVASFSERELGFSSFVDFVKATPGVALQIRTGSDMLLAPSSAAETLSAYSHFLPRLRRDFWRAFIEFPIPNTVRLYDESEDKVLYADAPTEKKGILIEPVPRDTQIQWRRKFAEEQPDDIKQGLQAALDGSGSTPFNEFARRLRENPAVMKAWNRYLQRLINDHVAAWAAAHNIPSERWRGGTTSNRVDSLLTETGSRPQTISQRAELYNFFDSLPIEDLLQLRVPLDWVLKVTRVKR
jgi:hypothetical protein